LIGPTAAAVAANPPHIARGLGRAHVTNDAGFLPKRTPSLFAQARRRRDLVEAFTAALGGEDAMSPVILMQIRRAGTPEVPKPLEATTMEPHASVACAVEVRNAA
jgi:hypothetical protein